MDSHTLRVGLSFCGYNIKNLDAAFAKCTALSTKEFGHIVYERLIGQVPPPTASDTPWESIYLHILHTVSSGKFDGDTSILLKFNGLQAALYSWLFPRKGPKVRDAKEVWKCLTLNSWAIGIMYIASLNHIPQKRYMRVFLRAFSYDVQWSLLFRNFSKPEWIQYCNKVFGLIVVHDSSFWDGHAVAYTIFTPESSIWYFGKTNTYRKKNHTRWTGPSARFKEHIECLFLKNGAHADRPDTPSGP